MSTISPIHEGTIAAKPFGHPDHGRIGGSHDHGRISGDHDRGRISGDHDHGRIGGNHNRGRIGGNHNRGRISGAHEHHSGGLHGKTGPGGRVGGDLGESPAYDAMAEIGNLITSLSSLSSQAQSLPLTPPTLPGLPQGQGYQMQPADYAFGDDAN